MRGVWINTVSTRIVGSEEVPSSAEERAVCSFLCAFCMACSVDVLLYGFLNTYDRSNITFCPSSTYPLVTLTDPVHLAPYFPNYFLLRKLCRCLLIPSKSSSAVGEGLNCGLTSSVGDGLLLVSDTATGNVLDESSGMVMAAWVVMLGSVVDVIVWDNIICAAAERCVEPKKNEGRTAEMSTEVKR